MPPPDHACNINVQPDMDYSEPDWTPTVMLFPQGQPRAPLISTPQGAIIYESNQDIFGESIWAPFQSQCDWELAYWAKTCRPTASAVTDLLAIPGLVEALGMSYHTSRELNHIIDNELPSTPAFKIKDITIGGEVLQFHYRDIIPCIRSLMSNPEFAHDLIFAPERHYTDRSHTNRIYNEMHTGDWWWSVQMALETRRPGSTVIPLILSTDKTLLTAFRGTTAYPIYMGTGNIPKDIRRKPSWSAQLLIGYILTSKLEGITNKSACRQALANLFHSCMGLVLKPVESYGETGLAMMCGDGTWRRCHPIFATFVGDYPEQTLVSCTYNGHCPKCMVPHDQLGDFNTFTAQDYGVAIDTYCLANEDSRKFNPACRAAGLKPVYHPFWLTLLLTDIFLAITPNILHQLLQGVMKHVVTWITHPLVFGMTDVNARCWSLPPNHHTTLFIKGLPFSRVTGKEHKDICRILIGLITDLPLPGGHSPVHVVRAVHAALDFVYLAQYPSHMTDTLWLLEDSLTRFHDNKDTFIALGVREDFVIPKVHSMLHYQSSITLFGTTDNYNMEQSERLHIKLPKGGYLASNCKDVYPQMTVTTTPKMTLHPTSQAVSFETLAEKYGALEIQDALADYIAGINHPGASAVNLRRQASDMLIPFRTVPVYHRIKFVTAGNSDNPEIVDTIHIRPEHIDLDGCIVPPRFDTVLVRGTQDVICGNHGLTFFHHYSGHQIAQICAVFQIPKHLIDDIFPGTKPPIHLAYAEWFTPFLATRDPNHQLHRVSRSMHNGKQRAMVIPVESILRSVHLLPWFGSTPPRWTSFFILENCNTFYVNLFSDRHNYLIFR
ncbi:hypothetical protein EI94DRAFT_1773493 [Lactarius quietus]|nr:hypothetical protein EI94DRAFT_1773493 [Lactarius quietus]